MPTIKLKMLSTVIAMTVMLAFIGVTQADSVTYQEGVSGGMYADTSDTVLMSPETGTNFDNMGYSTANDIRIETKSSNWRKYALIAFRNIIGSDPGQIASGSTITSAMLKLKAWSGTIGTTPTACYAYVVKRDWANGGEGTQNWAVIDSPGEMDATWNMATDFYPGDGTDVSWETAGCAGATDREQTSFLTSATIDGEWLMFDITHAVQEWADGADNYGILIQVQPYGVGKFYSSNYSVAADRPILEVNYTVPEPATLTLFGSCLFAFLRKRIK